MRAALLLAVAPLFVSSSTSSADPSPSHSRLVVALAATDRAGAAAGLTVRLECLGLAVERTLADGLPPQRIAGPALGPSPFDIDPRRVWLLAAADSAAAARASAALAADPAVAWVEPLRIREPALARLGARFPDDPLYRDTRQWGLWNAGPCGVYGGIVGADIHARQAWQRSVGSNRLRLAVADTGIDPAHPELALALPDGGGRIELGINVTADPAGAGAVADSFGHGTLVAGVMAARTGEGAHFDSLGIAGVCGGDGVGNLGCRLVPIKITPGRLGFATSFDIARGILYAAAVGARAVNLSFVGGGESAVERAALYHAITRGCVVVAASGNRGDGTPQYPAAYAADRLCIAVGASDPYDRRAGFSSYGPGLDVVAPGVNVWTTFMTYPSAAGARYPGYVAASGTSFAAPFATGTVGLLAALRPELTDTDFQRLIQAGADDIETPGPDATTGAGRLDAAAALAALDPSVGIWHDEVAGERFVTLAIDTLRVREPGPGTIELLRGEHRAERVQVETSVAVPDSFLGPVRVWPRVGGTFTVRGDFRLPYFAPWCEAEEANGGRFTLHGYLYRVLDQDLPEGVSDPWLPVPPDQARFGFTVMGRVDRPPALRLLAPGSGAVAVAGESLAVRWVASDPDTVTAVEWWLDRARGTPLLLGRVAGDAGAAKIGIPCGAAGGGPWTLRAVAIDDRGRQHDRSEASLALELRRGGCAPTPATLLLSATPNPSRGAVRLAGPAGGRVAIHDLQGRVVARVALDRLSGEGEWNGAEAGGRETPPGVYLARCESGGRVTRCKLVRLGAADERTR